MFFFFFFTECQVPGADPEINPTLESLCLSMTEHALGGKRPQQSGNKERAAAEAHAAASPVVPEILSPFSHSSLTFYTLLFDIFVPALTYLIRIWKVSPSVASVSLPT